jgi:PAS domain S-box-containing protein
VSEPHSLAPLEVLLVEDSEDDARLAMRELARNGFDVSASRVDTADGLALELTAKRWDVILADYTLPSFTGIDALRIAQRLRPEVPFIVVSGTITEEAAVAAMKAGASDYVLKNNLARLAPAVRRELADAALRAEHVRTARELLGVRARAAEELERSRQQLEIILRGVGEGILAHDQAGHIVYANDAAARALFAPSADALLGTDVDAVYAHFDLVDESGHPMAAEQMPGSLALGAGHPVERVVRLHHRATAEDRWYIVTSTWMQGTSASAPIVITIARDITERKRSEEASQYLATASAALSGSLDLPATLETTVRAAVPQLGDWSAIELGDGAAAAARSSTPAAVAPTEPRRADAVRTLWSTRLFEPSQRVMSSGMSELLDVDTNGPGRPAHHGAAMVIGLRTHERPFGTLTFGREERSYGPDEMALAEELARRASFALENARLYKESQEAIRGRDEFLAVASHELRTPLTALMLQLHVAQRYSGSPELPVRLDAAVRHTKRLASLVDNLLDASRITTGRMKVQLEELDLRDAVRDVVERFQEEAKNARSELVVHADASVVGSWDRLRVEQVVTNLLSNALKYGAGAPVELTVERAGASARVSVADHGIGIAPEDVARIFGKFERAVSARHYGGLGLGLFIARQIVEAHSGSIHVESTPGKGSTFTVELPLRPTAIPGAPATRPT